MTNAVDIIVFLRREDGRKMATAFPADGFYCPPLEVIECERTREQRGHFNLIHHESGFKADIYLTGRDELHAWGLSHAVQADLEGLHVMFAPPEYVIVRKRQFFREGGSQKHLRDISRMLMGPGDGWNRDTLMTMISTHHLKTEWQRVLAHVD